MIDSQAVDSHLQHQPFPNLAKSWTVCLTAALFFFYEFIQMNLFNAISVELMQSFHINATQLAELSSAYFIANVVFLFFAGILLDRYSVYKIILVTLSLCILGNIFFAFTTVLQWAIFFRFLEGVGSAFCFLSVLRLATRWFPGKYLGLVTGVIITIAMLGGVISQTPMALLADHIGWRYAMLVIAGVGVIIFVLIAWRVENFPPNFKKVEQKELAEIKRMGYIQSMKRSFLKMQNWLGGIYTCMMNLPLVVLGGLWGIIYLRDVHSLTRIQASTVTTMLFVGTIIGAPLVGWISDRVRLRRLPMMLGAILSFVVIMVLLIFSPHLAYINLSIIFLLMGFFTSSQIIGYPIVSESSLPAVTAMSISVVNITTQAGIILFQELYGYLMDLHHGSDLRLISESYLISDYKWAMWIFPIAFILALFAAIALRETYGRSRLEDEI